MRFIFRHFTAILIVAAVAGWAIFYLPNSPTWAVLRLKQSIDARDGNEAAKYVDFESVVKNAGKEMVKKQGGTDPLSAMLGNAAIDPLGIHGKMRSKPTVVAVHGRCLTVGIELCLAQDITVAADDTKFAQIEIKRGIFPFGGATIRWVQRSGWGNAMRWLLTGDELDAKAFGDGESGQLLAGAERALGGQARRRHGGCHQTGGVSGPASTWISPRHAPGHARRATRPAALAAGVRPGIPFTMSA